MPSRENSSGLFGIVFWTLAVMALCLGGILSDLEWHQDAEGNWYVITSEGQRERERKANASPQP